MDKCLLLTFTARVCFQDSVNVFATEKDGIDNTILLSVVRGGGYFGHVAVQWVATGDHNGLQDISPLSGTVCSE